MPPKWESPHLQLHVTLVCEEGSIVLIKRRGSILPHTHTPLEHSTSTPTIQLWAVGWRSWRGFYVCVCVCGGGGLSSGGEQLQDHTQENHPAHGLPCASNGLSVMPPPSFTCMFYSPGDLTCAVIVLPACLWFVVPRWHLPGLCLLSAHEL